MLHPAERTLESCPPSPVLAPAFLPTCPSISVCGPHAQTRASRGCHPHGLSFTLESGHFQMSVYHTWTLDVADDRTGGVVHEFDANLGHTSTGAYVISELLFLFHFSSLSPLEGSHTGTAEDSGDLDELDWDPVHFCQSQFECPPFCPALTWRNPSLRCICLNLAV